MKKILIVLVLTLWLAPVFAQAHPGRTDKENCHVCRTNCSKWNLKRGQYHCHPKIGTKVNTKKLCTIKGDVKKVGQKKVKTFYVKSSKKYASITIKKSSGDRWFCSEKQAKKAGFRRGK